MLSKLISFLGLFSLSFAILCIPVARRPLFYHLKDVASPIAQKVFSTTEDLAETGFNHVKKFGGKLFTNSLPNRPQSTKVSALDNQPKSSINQSLEEDLDSHTNEDRERLNQIIEESE